MNREIVPNREPYKFSGLFLDRAKKKVVFAWCAQTNIANVVKIAMLVIGFSWPPLRWFNHFLDKDKE